MLFNPKNQKAIKRIWVVICFITIISMVVFYVAGVFIS